MEPKNTYDSYVIRSILAANEFGITEVNDLESIRSMLFDKEQYSVVVSLIKEENWEKLKDLSEQIEEISEYLDILKFTDQNNEYYAVTIYDSDELWQDPHVIDIFTLT